MSTPRDTLDLFGLSHTSGFLPHIAPLRRLTDAYYAPWEEAVSQLPNRVASRNVRSLLDSLPILDTKYLKNEPEWRRAYVLLGFLTQAYIWGEDIPSEQLPPQISVPFLDVSAHHDLPPAATYSTLVLWNFAFQSPLCDLTDPTNLRSLVTVTGTKDEEWFYVISVALESRGGPIVLELLNCMEAVRQRDEAIIVATLNRTTCNIQKIGLLLQRMYEHCNPQTYYHDIRPLLAGTKGMATSGLPNGVFFNKGNGSGEWRQQSGGSNGQSSLIQLLDIALGVDHYATGEHRGRSSEAGPKSKANGYIKEVRNCMPGPHRAFLAYVEKTTNIREYALSAEASEAVRDAYVQTVTALSKFRDVHIQIVTRYIITPSKSKPAAYVLRKTGLNLATSSSSSASQVMKGMEGRGEEMEKPQLYGTGGTDLIPFLKQTRDETREAARG